MKEPASSQRSRGAEPRHRFVLNPYRDARFTRCPECQALMKVRKVPLLIHVDPSHLLALRKTVKLCPPCDLLIAHQDEIEQQLAFSLQNRAPEAIGNDYLVFGTVELADWRAGQEHPQTPVEILDRYHPFKEYLKLEVSGGWGPIDPPSDRPGDKRRKR